MLFLTFFLLQVQEAEKLLVYIIGDEHEISHNKLFVYRYTMITALNPQNCIFCKSPWLGHDPEHRIMATDTGTTFFVVFLRVTYLEELGL